MFFARTSNRFVKATSFDVLLKLLVPKRVEMIAKIRRELPCIFRRQFADRLSDFTNGAHRDTLDWQPSPAKPSFLHRRKHICNFDPRSVDRRLEDESGGLGAEYYEYKYSS